MLDIVSIRDHPSEMKENVGRRRMHVDIDRLLELDMERRSLISQADALRAGRNASSEQIATLAGEARAARIAAVRQLKTELTVLEPRLESVEAEYHKLLSEVPNWLSPEVPRGQSDADNVELRRVGEIRQFDFPIQDHVTIGERLGLIDFEGASKVVGSKFYFLRGDLVRLELALKQFALDYLTKAGFTPIKVPVLARQEILSGSGYNPRGEETQIYSLAGSDLSLIATSEISIAGYLSEELLEHSALPLKFVGISECYRTEAGNYGRHSKGLYRVHHFDKVEMFIFSPPEASAMHHAEMLRHEEAIFQALGIPYRVVDICDGDLGAVAYRKYDLEAWMPGRGESGDYGEVTSCSNCTDYQARRLNIRYRDDSGNIAYVHTLNGTALATSSRTLIALLENYQQADGSVRIPDVLVPHMSGQTRIAAL